MEGAIQDFDQFDCAQTSFKFNKIGSFWPDPAQTSLPKMTKTIIFLDILITSMLMLRNIGGHRLFTGVPRAVQSATF
jgi:hypothetical protein